MTRTERRTANKQRNSRENNLTILRWVATGLVFAGHMGPIYGGAPLYLGSFTLHELGVCVLFLLSGYLITMSWLSDPHPLRFGIRRFFRLWPPFAVMVLLMVFVAGPLVSDLGVRGYFQGNWQEYLKNLRFFTVYAQPGVFSSVPLPYTTNVSLWTMPVEAVLYVLTPILLTVMGVRGKSRTSFYGMLALAAIFCGADIVFSVVDQVNPVIVYGVNLFHGFRLLIFYVLGILYTYDEMRRLLNLQVAWVGMWIFLIFRQAPQCILSFMQYLILPYFMFSLAFAANPMFQRVGSRVEPSYGIYLYGFFFQQLVVSWYLAHGYSMTYLKVLIISGVPTLITAVITYFLVEKPALCLSRSLLRMLKDTEGGRRKGVQS